MNFPRLLLSAFAAFVVYFTYGFIVHGRLIAKDYVPYPVGVYRGGEDARSHVLFGLVGLIVAFIIFAYLYARSYDREYGVAVGARLGLVFGVFMVGAFVAVNYGTIEISGKLATELAISAPIKWTLAGIVVAAVYKPRR